MMIIPLSYNQLFSSTKLYEDLRDIEVPSTLVITLLSGINHRLYLGEYPYYILKGIIEGWDDDFKNAFKTSIEHIKTRSDAPIVIFSEWTITEYLKSELLNHNDLEFDWNTPTGVYEVVTIIRYFRFVDELMAREENTTVIVDDLGSIDFQRTSYPSFIKQFQFTGKTNPIFEMLCSYAFLKEMKKRFPLEVNDYLEKYEVNSEWQFSTSIIPVISESIPSTSKIPFPLIKSKGGDDFHAFYQQKVIDINEYQKNKKLQMRYIGLQSRPLYKIDANNLCVMSWRFLYNNIGGAVVFDFYEKTNIKNKYRSIPRFKSDVVSLEVYEQNIFKPLMKALFSKKHTVLEFDKGKGTPDCYMRQNNILYLFEFKDMLFSDVIVETGSYEDIMKMCKRNLIKNKKGRAKGLGQIAKQIEFLNNDTYDFDDFTSRKIKRSSITIYPVLVYSHKQFSFLGINKYVSKEFEEIIPDNDFKRIAKPVLISLDYMFSRKIMFSDVRLDKIIKKYHKQISGFESNLRGDKHLNEEKWFKSLTGQYNSIEQCYIRFHGVNEEDNFQKSRIINNILDEFEIGKMRTTASIGVHTP